MSNDDVYEIIDGIVGVFLDNDKNRVVDYGDDIDEEEEVCDVRGNYECVSMVWVYFERRKFIVFVVIEVE